MAAIKNLMPKRKLALAIIILFISITAIFSMSVGARAYAQENAKLSDSSRANALKNWIYLCAPCHDVKATGNEYGPALLGPNVTRHFTAPQLVTIFKNPAKHGLSEALPAFRKLDDAQREEMALWFSSLEKPEDIDAEKTALKPPPFLFVQNCSGCHGPDATGGLCPNLHNIGKKRDRESLMKLIEDPRNVGLKVNIMPPFPELSVDERSEIVDWLLTLQ
jgi:mono/diheme cytochrome c family protein